MRRLVLALAVVALGIAPTASAGGGHVPFWPLPGDPPAPTAST
jgi:hypothetical protein